MRPNRLRELWAAGKPALNCWITLPGTLAAEMLAHQGWDSLTSAELRVVHLVAQGLTNREAAQRLYVSTYTVGTHLKHAFEKVGVSSRVELTRLAMERTP